MTTRMHRGDLPDIARYKGAVAIDTETMGLDLARDRLCVVQLSPGDGSADVVQIAPHAGRAESEAASRRQKPAQDFSLRAVRSRHAVQGFRRDAGAGLLHQDRVAAGRTYTDKHGLKDLVREILGQEISKQQQSSDWGAAGLTDAQISYAASDVTHLHALKDRLDAMLAREGRAELAAACFRFLPERVRLDLAGFANEDIFAHS